MNSFCALLLFPLLTQASLSDRDLLRIGRRVWQNECAGTRDGLTSWNKGEEFASLGIGHFIWYPKGAREGFEESFPELLRFLAAHGVALPSWLRPDAPCPWKDRAAFEGDFHGERLSQLREILADTVSLQSRFLAQRMNEALPKMVAAAAPEDREKIRERFNSLAATGPGLFALIDYVNFKGEGTNPGERYQGEGWGLLQALSHMRGGGADPVGEFAIAAAEVLTERVHNAPPARHEGEWLPGWKKRVAAYRSGGE